MDVHLEPGERALAPTVVALALPEGYVAAVHPRSGLAARFGLSIVTAPGTVDPVHPASLRRRVRIAQLVVQRVEQATLREAAELPGSRRGAGGYGSTGGFVGAGAGTAAPPAVRDEEKP